jgi:D-alanyl-lipoteichoic acid acyltransferase DltB (MBOAT superfamily)
VLFNSRIFVFAFLPAALGGFLLAARTLGTRAALVWLVAASLFFYAWWQPAFLTLLLGSIGVNFCIGARLSGAHAKTCLILGLAFNLLLLGYFKYRGFIAASAGLPGFAVVLPLGISFFTFQQVMFLVDRYRGQLPAATKFLDYICFVAFFPHLIAGPIVRPRDIIPQFQALAPLRDWRTRLLDGMEIFLLGLAKKIVLADSFSQFADPGFAAAAAHEPLTLIEAWVALLAYALQIYFDFSGYSDMAIGLARMFGIKFPRNFVSPYQARNIADFWRRWNITLSAFLRDYLYIPLGGNRKGEARRVANVMATMLLGGLWHGAALKFLLWGGLHGLYLTAHGWFAKAGLRLPALVARALTLLAVLLAWVPFRAQDFATAAGFYKALLGGNGVAVPDIFARFAPAIGGIVQVVPVLPYLGDARTLSLPLALAMLVTGWTIVLTLPDLHSFGTRRRSFAMIGGFAFTMQALLLAPSAVPFLYFQF